MHWFCGMGVTVGGRGSTHDTLHARSDFTHIYPAVQLSRLILFRDIGTSRAASRG